MELEFDICQTKLSNQLFFFSVDMDENGSLNYHNVAEDPNVSIPHRSQELEMSYGVFCI